MLINMYEVTFVLNQGNFIISARLTTWPNLSLNIMSSLIALNHFGLSCASCHFLLVKKTSASNIGLGLNSTYFHYVMGLKSIH